MTASPLPAASTAASALTGGHELVVQLSQIWREVLRVEGPLDPDRDFFELGGDSLCSIQLAIRIEEAFGRRVTAEEFFQMPTFFHLLELIETGENAPAPEQARRETNVAWPLDANLRHRQMSYFETWPGERPTRDRLIAGLNTKGTRPPLFWVFQGAEEFKALAQQLGHDQPLYGMRSGHELIGHTEDEIQSLALRYVHEILETLPRGPRFIGGNCQGAMIALAIAQHLQRRGHHIPLLALLEWQFEFPFYGGKVLLLYGRESSHGNPFLRYREPEIWWRRAFPDHSVAAIPGAHGHFFRQENVGAFAGVLAERLASALSQSPRLPSRPMYAADFVAQALPSSMERGETRSVSVKVRNAGSLAWDAKLLGLALHASWSVDPIDGSIVREGRVPLPSLTPGADVFIELPVTAPQKTGQALLSIDLIDEGSVWRLPSGEALQALVMIHQKR